MELIDRAKVERITFQEPSYSDPINVLTEVRDKVRALPTVEAEPVRHGKWKPWDSDGLEDAYECTACGDLFVLIEGTPITNGYKYCPNCGAKMDERRENV